MTVRARVDLERAWQVLCLFVVEECQPPDWMRRIWRAVMWLLVAVAAWLLFVLVCVAVVTALAAVAADFATRP